jgi:hypothetical protein
MTEFRSCRSGRAQLKVETLPMRTGFVDRSFCRATGPAGPTFMAEARKPKPSGELEGTLPGNRRR